MALGYFIYFYFTKFDIFEFSMDEGVVLVFHHGAHFESNPKLVSIKGEEDFWDYLDVDKILVLVVDQLFKEHHYWKLGRTCTTDK